MQSFETVVTEFSKVVEAVSRGGRLLPPDLEVLRDAERLLINMKARGLALPVLPQNLEYYDVNIFDHDMQKYSLIKLTTIFKGGNREPALPRACLEHWLAKNITGRITGRGATA